MLSPLKMDFDLETSRIDHTNTVANFWSVVHLNKPIMLLLDFEMFVMDHVWPSVVLRALLNCVVAASIDIAKALLQQLVAITAIIASSGRAASSSRCAKGSA